jgi:4-amino-4-deoxy-L-arabinose transferase-like glycosyltransferase
MTVGAGAHRPWSNMLSFLVIAVFSVLIFFNMLGAVPLFNPDEGLFAEPAREMLETGQYLTTLLNYVVRFTKPPLVIWAMALSYKIFGVNEFAARFFVAASACILVLVTYMFAQKFLGSRIAKIAALVLLTSPLFIGVGREAITDMPLSLFLASSIMSFYFAFRAKSIFAKWLGYVLVALAIMTKGPVGALLPGTIMLTYFYLRGQLREAWRFFSVPQGSLLTAIIALPWFIAEIWATKGAYFNEFILRENFARFTSVIDSHKGPIWYHVLVIMAGLFPWSLCLPAMIIAVSSTMTDEAWLQKAADGKNQLDSDLNPAKNPLDKVVHQGKRVLGALKKLDEREEVLLLCALTALMIIVFFSLSVSKLLPYTLPAFPALSIMIAAWLDYLCRTGQVRKLLVGGGAFALGYAAIFVLTPIFVQHMKDAPTSVIAVAKLYSACAFGAVLLASLICLRKHLYGGVMLFGFSLLLITCSFGPQFLKELSYTLEENVAEYARFTAASQYPIFLFDVRKPGVPFYCRRKVILAANRDALLSGLEKSEHAYVITRKRDCASLMQVKGLKLLQHGERFALLTFER